MAGLTPLACTFTGSRNGDSSHPLYGTFRLMFERCYNPANTKFKNYGGRGIEVCPRWQGVDGFKNFIADVGDRPENTTLDRINVNGGYSPDNCRWADKYQQGGNKTTTALLPRQIGKDCWEVSFTYKNTTIFDGRYKTEQEALTRCQKFEALRESAAPLQEVLAYVFEGYQLPPSGRKMNVHKSSRYWGVSFHRARNKWLACPCTLSKKKGTYLGRYDTEEEANEVVVNFIKNGALPLKIVRKHSGGAQ